MSHIIFSLLLYIKPSSKRYYALLAVIALIMAVVWYIIFLKHDVHKNDR